MLEHNVLGLCGLGALRMCAPLLVRAAAGKDRETASGTSKSAQDRRSVLKRAVELEVDEDAGAARAQELGHQRGSVFRNRLTGYWT